MITDMSLAKLSSGRSKSWNPKSSSKQELKTEVENLEIEKLGQD